MILLTLVGNLTIGVNSARKKQIRKIENIQQKHFQHGTEAENSSDLQTRSKNTEETKYTIF